jgi:outer membrane receptor protein involved in Fe transport
VDFALQAGISIGGTTACAGTSHRLEGNFTLEDGLTRLLAGLPCHFEILDERTVRLAGAPRPAPVRAAAAMPAPLPAAASAPDEIIISATKRSVAADRLAASVSVVTADRLRDGGLTEVGDTVSTIAGMSMTNLGPGQDKILLRGLSDGTFTGRTQSTVGTYLDDLPVNFNSPDPDLRLTDIEAVEVVRGPQGALYGSGALSGLYRIVTNKPDPGSFAASVQISNAWTQSAAGSRSADGMINLPLAEGRSALRIVAYGDLQGGYLGNSDLKQSDVDRTSVDGGRAALSTRLGDTWTVTAGATLQSLETADAQYTTTPTDLNRANRVSESNRNEFGQGSLTIVEAGDWGRLSSATGYVHHNVADQYDASAALSLFDDDNSSDIGIYDETAQTDLMIEDLVASSPSDSGPVQWLVGVYGAATVERSSDILFSRRSSRAVTQLRYQENRRDRLNEFAPYAELTWLLGGGWGVTGGGRLFDSSLRTTSEVMVPLPHQSRDRLNEGRYDGWAPKASLYDEIAQDAMVYALYSEGYRPGGFNAGGIAASNAASAPYSPDRLKNYEIGAKSKFWGGAVEARMALFRDLWQDMQTDQYLPSGLSYTANVGDARVLGWENEVVLHPSSGLTLSFNDLFDSARLTKATAAFSSLISSGLPGIPTFSFGSGLSYETPLDEAFALLAGGSVAYVGRSRLTFQPALSPSMGGYVTARLTAGVKSADWRLLMVLDNPANTQGDTFAFGNPFSFGQVRQVTPLRPRTLRLSLSANF